MDNQQNSESGLRQGSRNPDGDRSVGSGRQGGRNPPRAPGPNRSVVPPELPAVAAGGGESPSAPSPAGGLAGGTPPAGPVDTRISPTAPQRPLPEIQAAEPGVTDPFFSGRKHFPELDGLRGIAILAVMASHYQWFLPPLSPVIPRVQNLLAKGWCGVDLFFVLSGFLITGILADSKGQERFFRSFYARRFLRIFPLYYGVLSVMLVALLLLRAKSGADFYNHPERVRLWSYQPWLWTYTDNIWMSFTNKVMLLVAQFWTLAVEEQFYLFWPLVVLVLSGRNLFRLCVVVIIASPFLRWAALAAGCHAGMVYMLTPFRMDAFASGALVALSVRSPLGRGLLTRWASWAMPLLGSLIVVLLVGAWCWQWRWHVSLGSLAAARTKLPGGIVTSAFIYSLLAVFFAAAVALARLGPEFYKRGLRLAPLRSCGKYSYGMYIFHYPLIGVTVALAGRTRLLSLTHHSISYALLLVAANFTLSLSAAYASYHLYEKHFLKLKKYFPERAGTAAAR